MPAPFLAVQRQPFGAIEVSANPEIFLQFDNFAQLLIGRSQLRPCTTNQEIKKGLQPVNPYTCPDLVSFPVLSRIMKLPASTGISSRFYGPNAFAE